MLILVQQINHQQGQVMSNRHKLFFTSDLHIGHANSIIYDNRPFKDLNDMHNALIKRYNATVPENATCYFLGDIGLSSTEYLKDFMSRLNSSKKILVLGNHDRGRDAMYAFGFDAVLNGAMLSIAGSSVTLSHCPLRGVYRENTIGMKGAIEGDNWHGESRHDKYSFPDFGQYHLHGHIHSPNSGKSVKILDRQYDVGGPANNYTPVSISEIESWIAKHKMVIK
jgi:calcineurin-like phosphoesterase family protein